MSFYDLGKYDNTHNSLRGNCPSFKDLLDDMTVTRNELKKFNDSILELDQEFEKCISEYVDIENELNDNFFNLDKDEYDNWENEEQMDFEQKDVSDNTVDDTEEVLDESNNQQIEINKKISEITGSIEKLIFEIDKKISAEISIVNAIKEENKNLKKLLDDQIVNKNNLEEVTKLNDDLVKFNQIKCALSNEIYNYEDNNSIRKLKGICEEIKKKAHQYKLNNFWSGVASSVISKVKNLEKQINTNADKFSSRINKVNNLLATVNEEIKDRNEKIKLVNDIQNRGLKIAKNLNDIKNQVEKDTEIKLVDFISGKWTGKSWELSIADSKDLVRPIVNTRRKKNLECNSLINKIDETQPELDDLSIENYNKTHIFPKVISVGKMYYESSSPYFQIEAPVLIDVPSKRPLLVQKASHIAPILLRLAWSMPQGKIEIIAIDHEKSGENIQLVNDLSDISGLLTIVTEAEGLKPVLESLDKYMGKMSTQYFKGRITSWAEYNEKNLNRPLPCKVVAICSLAGFDSWTDNTAKLQKLMENGFRHGIIVILTQDALSMASDKIQSKLKDFAWQFIDKSDLSNKLGSLKYEYTPLEMPDNASDKMKSLCSYVEELKKQSVKAFKDLFRNVPMWKESSAKGLKAPIGWDSKEQRPVYFKLDVEGEEDGTAVHALVGGRTGSGKSVLLHTLIMSLAHVYSPDDLQFYLFDFKDGVEFNKYSNGQGTIWLPHVQMVSVQNDPRYALELFTHLVDVELPSRNEIFKKSGSAKIDDYVKKGGKMPRLVVIVDEFQELFGGSDSEDTENIGGQITEKLAAICAKGRSVGIHLIIATQSMANAYKTMKGKAGFILQQIGLRLALSGNGEEGILADNNKEASKIIAKKQCIINTNAGINGHNVVFDFPFSSPNSPDGEIYKKNIEEATSKGIYQLSRKIFNGTTLPTSPDSYVIKNIIKQSIEVIGADLGMNLGVLPDFSATPFVVPLISSFPGENLLIGAEDEGELIGGISPKDAWEGISASIINSIKSTEDSAIFYYNPHPLSKLSPNNLPSTSLKANKDTTENDLLNLIKKFVQMPQEKKVFVVENFHLAKFLHPSKQNNLFGNPFGAPQDENKEVTARSIFLSALDDTGSNIPFSVVLITKNVKTTCEKILGRNLLEAFTKRIAFNISGDTLRTMIPSSNYEQQKGPRRIWYEDTRTSSFKSFVPYSKTKD